MKRDTENFLREHGQFVQGDNLYGLYKAIVMDNRDPFMQGRCRVHIYNLHSDYKDLPITVLPWAEPADKNAGAPPRFARVWVFFEAGDLSTPVYFGRWYGIPAGRGKLPFNSSVGSELPLEVWSVSDGTPEGQILGASPEGSAVAIHERLLGESMGVASTISMTDTGSKFFRITSIHPEREPWVIQEARRAKPGKSLEDEDVSEAFSAIRDGYSEPVHSAGSIEFGFANLEQSFSTSKDKRTIARITQSNEDDEDSNLALVALDGQILAMRQQNASLVLADDALIATGPNGLLANRVLSPPERWD